MAYITLPEAKQYLGNDVYLSAYDDVDNEGTPDDTTLQNDVDGITARIDMAIMQAYDKAITGTKALNYLRDLSGRLLLSRAYERYSFSEVPESVIQQRKESTAALLAVQDGKLRFDDETQESKGSVFKYAYQDPNTDGTGRQVFNRSTMSGY
jgi:hypothetical protein